ncbi:MAG TPA: GNAT family N-acetyltransferase [Holophagaceae bacterium]|nr:GNAT family N-acetyltransferase [Holophagaceae bacterium]
MATCLRPLIWERSEASVANDVRIRPTRGEDLAHIPSLMRRIYAPPQFGPEAVWSEASLRSHLRIFPEGQFVAVLPGGRLVGTATCMRVALLKAVMPHTWSGITGRGTLETHDPEGDALYGVNIAVDPLLQGMGIGHALYRARLTVGRRLGCCAFVAGARLAGYRRHDYLSPEQYLEEVRTGRLYDPTLSKQMALGFSLRGLLRNYAPDPETHGHAALISLPL